MKKYTIEKDGQIDFFNQFQIDYINNEVLIDNTDGVYNGNLIEFKLNIENPNRVLFQAIKYLSKMRIKGEPVPARILCISLNTTTCYVYNSQDYFEDIHKIYFGGASTQNDGFTIVNTADKVDYSTMEGALILKGYLKDKKYMRIRLDEDCIVGWANKYYREYPKASKGDFLDDRNGIIQMSSEIRDPKVFQEYILPYTGKSNEKFKYLMDALNDKLHKKDLGAFYTPLPYCKKAVELLREAIKKVPDGNDFVIIDRCAGTGNLESVLTDEELSHCIVSTYEYYEYKVLLERLGDKVRLIIPPIEAQVIYSNGYVANADALSESFINNSIIKKYIDDPKCTVILYENPPYSESGSIDYIMDENFNRVFWKNSYVMEKYCEKISGTSRNEMANLFIWSGFEYYLKKPNDSYILFSPIKYWKSQNVINKKFVSGFIFNRKYFKASPSAITCILWKNENSNIDDINLKVYDIENPMDMENSGLTLINDDYHVKKVYNLFSEYYDKRKFEDDESGIAGGLDGKEVVRDFRINPKYNKNIIAYMITQKFTFDNPRLATNLTRLGMYNGNGFYLRSDNFMTKLPLFTAGKYPIEDRWYENGTLYKSFDGGDKFVNDKDFLKYCLIFTCLSYYNKCLSLEGSDGRFYVNELCFDNGTLASNELEKVNLNEEERELINLWKVILNDAKKTKNYNSNYKYGIFQITRELNTFEIDENGNRIFHYPELNGNLNTLKTKLKKYYEKYIIEKLFFYELIK